MRRLAALYALLDNEHEVEPEHLCAALALWEFSVASVKHIFGEKVGDRLADTILAALRVRPRTDSEISGLFSGNVLAERLTNAKEMLRSQGKIIYRTEPTGGRPKNVWELYEINEKNERRVR